MGELIGHEATAEHPQALAIRGRFECSVVDDPDQLSADEYVYAETQRGCSLYRQAVCEPLRAVLWRDSGKFWQPHRGGTRLRLRL